MDDPPKQEHEDPNLRWLGRLGQERAYNLGLSVRVRY